VTQPKPKALSVRAPAKINLHLRVGPPRAGDGFHPILSWMVAVGLFDKLEFVLVDRPGITLTCDDPVIPCDASNLIVKTASALLRPELVEGSAVPPSEARRRGIVGISAALQKRIPVGAGLGGGSSDGASTLIVLNQLLGLNWPPDRLSDLAARFGSDLPFFFHGPSSVCSGRGEIVTPTPSLKPQWVVLILPGIHMATAGVYRRFDEMGLGNPDLLSDARDWRQLATLDALDLLPHLVNDLEAPAYSLSPPLADLHARATQAIGRIVRMSGSGSSLFTLFDAADEAHEGAEILRRQLAARVEVVERIP
jgi:4-diphosphocytidyl-2-C-methyl-D-erythritol kinase